MRATVRLFRLLVEIIYARSQVVPSTLSYLTKKAMPCRSSDTIELHAKAQLGETIASLTKDLLSSREEGEWLMKVQGEKDECIKRLEQDVQDKEATIASLTSDLQSSQENALAEQLAEGLAKAKSVCEERVQQEKERRVKQARRIVKRMLHSQLAGAFDTYSDRLKQMKRQRETYKRVILRMKHVALASALDTWCGTVAHRKLVEKAISRWCSPAMATAMWAWVEHMEVVDQERKAAGMEEARLQLAGECEMTKRQKEALQAEVEAEKCRRVEQARRIVKRMQHSQLAGAFDTYSERVAETKRKRELCKQVVLRMQHRALAGAFDMFSRTVEHLQAHRQLVEKAMRRWRSPAMATAMWAWVEHMEVVDQERKAAGMEEARLQLAGELQSVEQEVLGLRHELDGKSVAIVSEGISPVPFLSPPPSFLVSLSLISLD